MRVARLSAGRSGRRSHANTAFSLGSLWRAWAFRLITGNDLIEPEPQATARRCWGSLEQTRQDQRPVGTVGDDHWRRFAFSLILLRNP